MLKLCNESILNINSNHKRISYDLNFIGVVIGNIVIDLKENIHMLKGCTLKGSYNTNGYKRLIKSTICNTFQIDNIRMDVK